MAQSKNTLLPENPPIRTWYVRESTLPRSILPQHIARRKVSLLRDHESSIYIGNSAGNSGATGTANVCIGANSGSMLTTGDCNTFVGDSSGNTITTGSRNVIIGVQNTFLSQSTSNNVVADRGIDNSGTSNITIGNGTVTSNNNILFGVWSVGPELQAFYSSYYEKKYLIPEFFSQVVIPGGNNICIGERTFSQTGGNVIIGICPASNIYFV